MPGKVDMGQHVIHITKPGMQDIFVPKKRYKYDDKKSCVIYSTHEDFYPGDKEHPTASIVGVII